MVRQFKDNNAIRLREDPKYNKCHKVQPLVDCFLSVLKNMVSPETFVSVDEQVNPLNVKYSMKCYLPKNPKKVGMQALTQDWNIWLHLQFSSWWWSGIKKTTARIYISGSMW